MTGKLEKLFSEWKVEKVEFPEIPNVERKFTKGVFVVAKDINQGYVRLLSYLSPDQRNPRLFHLLDRPIHPLL